jgi:3-isopropylmalate/(R)-2-methylmalate dehydratase small subunit
MEPLVHLDAVALPIARPNVDTDQIVPARYLQKPRSDNFGDYLFRDVREDPAFVFNREPYRGARIVVAERNFGCGSSREHAVWALYDHGFRAAIAPSFGDIFAGNALKNGFLPIVLPAATVARLLAQLEAQPGARIAVDLPRQVVRAPDGAEHAFEIDAFAKHCLIEGLDEISYTLTLLPAIEAHEARLARDIG